MTCKLFSQVHENDMLGDWVGTIKLNEKNEKIVYHIFKKGKKITGTMDSPDQNAYGLELSEVSNVLKYVKFELKSFKLAYKGRFIQNDSIVGEFKQGNYTAELHLKKSKIPISNKPNRPQEPQAPFPYEVKEVKFKNSVDNITLKGTLTIPKGKGPFPAVVLVSGSGPQNRDEEIMSHKPFLVIADYLTKNGIAVLRYDDRGVGESEGDFQKATTADFALDAQSAYIYLKGVKKIDKIKVGLLGHSEGGMVAQMVAAADTQVRMIVLLAAPGVKISELMLKQTEMNLKMNGIPDEEIKVSLELNRKFYQVLLEEEKNEEAKIKIEQILNDHIRSMTSTEANQIRKEKDMMIKTLLSPWFRYFIKFDPDQYLKQIKCAVLAINGEKDVQVSCDDNLFGIAMGLEKYGNRRYEFHKMPGLNHLMQHSTSGGVNEYMKIEETFSEEVLSIIKTWIKAR